MDVAAMVGKWMGRGVDEVEWPKWGRRREKLA